MEIYGSVSEAGELGLSDKGEGGVKNIKKWVTSFMDDHPYCISSKYIYGRCFINHFSVI